LGGGAGVLRGSGEGGGGFRVGGGPRGVDSCDQFKKSSNYF